MIRHIRITAGPLSGKELRDLGRINVICGKNNSGKSLLLHSAIVSSGSCGGINIDGHLIEAVTDRLSQGLRSELEHNRIFVVFQKTVEKILLGHGDVLFENDAEALVSSISAAISSNGYLSRYRYEFPSLVKLLTDSTQIKRDVILLETKRQIRERSQINSSSEPDGKGDGLLDRLFFLKNQSLNSGLHKKYLLLHDAFMSVTGGETFDVEMEKDNMIRLTFSSGSGPLIASRCGQGLRDVLMILFHSVVSDKNIVAIEEPEIHLHPEMQRRLFTIIDQQKEKQFFIVTHSNVIVSNPSCSKVLLVQKNSTGFEVSDKTTKAVTLANMGYSFTENLSTDLLILVEGPSDVPVVREFLRKFDIGINESIKFFPLGGDTMDQHDLSAICDGKKVIVLNDKDPESAKVRGRMKRKCESVGIHYYRLEGYAIENYFEISAIKAIKEFNIDSIDDQFEISMDSKLDKQIGVNVKKNNREIAELTSVEHLRKTDFNSFVALVRKVLNE